MMTLHPISAGSGIDYLIKTAVSGDVEIKTRDLSAYWSSGGDTPGEWIGRQASAAGLIGKVTQEAADAVFKDGELPGGRALGRRWPVYLTADQHYERALKKEPNATEARREQLRAEADTMGNKAARAGWETVLSPVKSWSILWGTADDETRAQLEEAENTAFTKIWTRIENEAAWTRVGAQGAAQLQVDAGLMGAAFVHRSSRAGDPDWHRHVAISAKVQHADGRWLALDARPLHQLMVALSEQYTTELERKMFERFGIRADVRPDSIRPDKRPVREYAAVPAELVHEFSQRRAQTQEALAGLLAEFREREGREPSRPEQYTMAQAAALTQRPNKESHSIEAERASWRHRAREAGILHPERWLNAAQAATEQHDEEYELPAPETVVEQTISTLEQMRETWTRANVEAETYRQLTASGWHLAVPGEEFDDLVRQLVEAALSPEHCQLISPPELHTVPSRYLRRDGTSVFVQHGSARFTSHRILRWETDLVASAREEAPILTLAPEQINAVLDAGNAARGFAPSAEQRAAVQDVFTGNTRTHAMIGRAGTGKTTIMRLVKEVADAYGLPVLGLANGQVQADNLGDAAGIRTENIARWLANSGTAPTHPAAGQDGNGWKLAPGTIVIVDEAGQASTPHLHALLEQVSAAGGRLLPIGDPRQLGSPGVGGALALIEACTQATYLTEVRRFRSSGGTLREWEIEAATAIAEGDAQASWEAYTARGRIHSGPQESMVDAAYQGWTADVNDGLASVLIAPTNAIAAQLSERARTDRVAAGLVDDEHTVTLHTGARAGAGDVIVTRLNARHLACDDTRQWVRNGDMWAVLEATGDGDLVIEHTLTRGVTTLPAAYVDEAVELGYAITTARAQGITVDTGHALLNLATAANGAYPALTRGALANVAYLCTDPGIDAETGEPGRALTAHQAWAQIISRDGMQLSATAQTEQAWDAIESLRTNTPRLRTVLDDIAERMARDAVTDLLGPDLGPDITGAPAWPALWALLRAQADDGVDTDQLITTAAEPEWFGTVEDHAAVLHARISRIVDKAKQPKFQDGRNLATAPRLQVEPDPTAGDIMDRLGLHPPSSPGETGAPEGEDDLTHYASELADTLRERANHLAEQAHSDARQGRGWAGAYGPEPLTVAEVVAWRDQLSAAAQYRDYTGYTGRDATGPAPSSEDSLARSLWRAAQRTPDLSDAYRETLTLARTADATWMDAIGIPPAPGDPARQAWANAVTAVTTYRSLWEHGHENVAIGEQPAEPIQARDWTHARRELDAWRWVKAVPQLAELDGAHLDLIIAQGNAGQTTAAEAAAAVAAHQVATAHQIAAEQTAEDAANRLDVARRTLQGHPTQGATSAPGPDHVPDGDRLAELEAEAQQTRDNAETARQMSAATRNRVRETAPTALAAREQIRAAEHARQQIAHRLSTAGDWQARPHGALTDAEIHEATKITDAEARALPRAPHPSDTTGTGQPEPASPAAPDPRSDARTTAPAAVRTDDTVLREQLTQHAEQLRAELRLREQLPPERRAREDDERRVTRARSTQRTRTSTPSEPASQPAKKAKTARTMAPTTQDRLRKAYERPDPTRAQRAQHQHRDRDREQDAPQRPDRRRSHERQPLPRNQAEARLTNAQQDTTGPEATERARNRARPASMKPSTKPTTKPATAPSGGAPAAQAGPDAANPKTPAPPQEPAKKAPRATPKKTVPRTANQRLNRAYDADQDPQKNRKRPPQPPAGRRGGPSI